MTGRPRVRFFQAPSGALFSCGGTATQRSTEEFVFGPERAAYEARLPSAVQDLVAELLVVYPAATRQFLRDRLYARIESDAGLRGSSATRRALQAVLEETMAHGRSAMAAE